MQVDIDDVPLDDETTYELLRRVTVGVFQLEAVPCGPSCAPWPPPSSRTSPPSSPCTGRGRCRRTCTTTTPTARTAGSPSSTCTRTSRRSSATPTGLMIYQESVMRVAQKFAGYSLADADNLGRPASRQVRSMLTRTPGLPSDRAGDEVTRPSGPDHRPRHLRTVATKRSPTSGPWARRWCIASRPAPATPSKRGRTIRSSSTTSGRELGDLRPRRPRRRHVSHDGPRGVRASSDSGRWTWRRCWLVGGLHPRLPERGAQTATPTSATPTRSCSKRFAGPYGRTSASPHRSVPTCGQRSLSFGSARAEIPRSEVGPRALARQGGRQERSRAPVPQCARRLQGRTVPRALLLQPTAGQTGQAPTS